MIDSIEMSVLAIDGGGTRCRIAYSDGKAITSVETGSANVSTDFDGSVREILSGIDALSAKLEAQLNDQPTFVGLAGVTGPQIADRLRAALPFRKIRIEDDRPAALRGALGDRNGVVAHCGTGSFFGSRINGQTRLFGGWGPALGDEASAQWIGRLALSATLQAVDGRAPMSAMAETFIERFGGVPGIVQFAGAASPKDFGALAPLVTEMAHDGDRLAIQVLQAGADEIARSLPLIGWTPGLAICLTGGIGPHFASYLPNEMRAEVVLPKGEPLVGALALALELAEETAR